MWAMIKLYFLGSGGSVPTAKRFAPSIALVVDSDIYLFDCGEGSQVRMYEAGLSPLKVRVVSITHSHGDHIYGLPPLLESMGSHDRSSELMVVAPKDVWDLVSRYSVGGERDQGFPIRILSPEEGYVDLKLSIKGFRTCHLGESWGYRVDVSRGRKSFSLCYTGDTEPCSSVIDSCRGVDLLIHESTYVESESREALEYKHSTALGAAIVARDAGVGELYLVHISPRYRDPAGVLAEARRVFDRVRVAHDLMVTYIML